MCDHWRTLIQDASRTRDVPGVAREPGPDGEFDAGGRIAREMIRLARVAVAAHLVAAAGARRPDAAAAPRGDAS